MGTLMDLNLSTSYTKGQHDIAKDFYLPVMAQAMKYDRAVGFFNSAIYAVSWPTLKDFVRGGGRMRLICSPLLSPEDVEAMAEGYQARIDEDQAARLRAEIRKMLDDPYLRKPTRVLASLVALGAMEVKIAFMSRKAEQADPRHRRLFHDKVGIVTDQAGSVLVFKGSMNETWSGLSLDGNLESIDVFISWGGSRDEQRIGEAVRYFESLWDNVFPLVSVREFPQIAMEELLREADVTNWPDLVDDINRELNAAVTLSADRTIGGRVPRPHQVQALRAWQDAGRRGILEHATGSGKTFTALCAIRDSLAKQEIPLILVPGQILLKQWYEEIHDTFGDLDVHVLRCGDGHTEWRGDGLLRLWTKPGPKVRIVIATMQTASSNEFLAMLRQGNHLFLVADEVHRLGSPKNQRAFSITSGPRLGLSATPRRAGDPVGTLALMEYFGGIVPPPFTLQDAIKSNTLTRYMYRVHRVYLSDDEQEEWDRLTDKSRQLYAQNITAERPDPVVAARIHRLLVDRARILKKAKGKIPLALQVIRDRYVPGQWWIVYCEDREQLTEVLMHLRANGYNAAEYHSGMAGDQAQTLAYFDANGGILVSIRCLDEGVDIPSVSHALILASSKNPREFVQRRGRVLRKAPNKRMAFIHDAVVIPNQLTSDGNSSAIVEGELARAIEFGQGAENPASVSDLQRIAANAGLDYKRLLEEGVEDDE